MTQHTLEEKEPMSIKDAVHKHDLGVGMMAAQATDDGRWEYVIYWECDFCGEKDYVAIPFVEALKVFEKMKKNVETTNPGLKNDKGKGTTTS